MEKKPAAAAGAMLILIALATALVAADGAGMSCSVVANSLYPCMNFVLAGGVGAAPIECCNGIKSLYGRATSTADRQAVCSCLKSVASSASRAMVNAAARLPNACGVPIPYKISPSTDCSTVR